MQGCHGVLRCVCGCLRLPSSITDNFGQQVALHPSSVVFVHPDGLLSSLEGPPAHRACLRPTEGQGCLGLIGNQSAFPTEQPGH